MLPAVLLAATGVFLALRAEGERIQKAALDRSKEVMTRIDAALNRDIAVLHTLSTSIFFETLDWENFQTRIDRVARANQHWATLMLYEAPTGRRLLDLRRPFGPPVTDKPLDARILQTLQDSRQVVVDGIRNQIFAAIEPLIYLYQPIVRDGRLRYVMVLAIHPSGFQDILLDQVPANSIAAVVDRDGNFIARSRDYRKHIGRPATQYVRRAIRDSKEGFYRGVTYEGLDNYSAFYASPLSGWSAHIAVASGLIDTPAFWSFATAGLAGLAGIALAAILALLVLRDMSERRRMDELLKQTQKMEAVGQLTGGIAHDFNNLLTAVIGNLDLIRNRARDNERLLRPAERALNAARLGAKLASRLLAFSRTQRLTLMPVDLQTLLDGMMGLLRQSVGPTVTISVLVDADARMVMSDGNQLELALLNIAVNARDAMPRGGVLTLHSRRAEPRETKALPQRPYATLCISDTGAGMSEEVRARAMEPFYTTKPVGQGTGLGLAQVYGIVRESGGWVDIDSKLGQGTAIKLVLPMAAEGSVAAPRTEYPELDPLQARPDRSHTVLVLDDDPSVRRLMCESLTELGYRVLEADNGEAALRLVDRQQIDLLISDFAMPDRNGADIARAAQRKQPDLAILIVSGYADSGAINAALGDARLLRKPFDVAELAAAVETAIRSRPT